MAVHVNGQEMELEREVSLASGMNITYSNTTVSDGTLWFKPGEWTLPQLTIKTPRWVACCLPDAIENPSSVGCPCRKEGSELSATNIDLSMGSPAQQAQVFNDAHLRTLHMARCMWWVSI